MTDRMDPATRARVSAAGGAARVAGLNDVERSDLGQSGARAANAPLSLARRIARAWPGLDDAERAALRDLLLPVLAPPDAGESLGEAGPPDGDDQVHDQVAVKPRRPRARRQPVD